MEEEESEIYGESEEELEEEEDFAAVVMDCGSDTIKVGFAGELCPRTVFPSLLGRRRMECGKSYSDWLIGDDAFRRRSSLELRYPIQRGLVTNWDDMEKIWRHAFCNQLRLDPRQHPVLLTEVPLNPKNNRERLTQVIFESFSVPAMYLAQQAVLTLYSSGRTTGVVADCGSEVCQAVPVCEGQTLPHAVRRLELGGRDVTEYLLQVLSTCGYKFTTSLEKAIVADLKEKLCYVCRDFQSEMMKVRCGNLKEKPFELPDGSVLMVGAERFRCPELLFQPSLIGKDDSGIQHMLYQSIQWCNVDLRSVLASNVVLAGGSSLFDGMPERIGAELEDLVDGKMIVKVAAEPTRKYCAWMGGSVLASLGPFQQMWIAREEYEDHGPEIVHDRCY